MKEATFDTYLHETTEIYNKKQRDELFMLPSNIPANTIVKKKQLIYLQKLFKIYGS